MKEKGYLQLFFANGKELTYVGDRKQISEAIHQINVGYGFIPVLVNGVEQIYLVRNIVSFILTNKPLEEAIDYDEVDFEEVVVKGFRAEDESQ